MKMASEFNRMNPPLTIPDIDTMILQLKKNKEYSYYPLLDTKMDNRNVKEKIAEISMEIESASKQISEIFHYVQRTQTVPLQEINHAIIPTITKAAEIPHIYYLFKEMLEKDEYTYRHNICVGIISTYIGKWLGLTGEALTELTLASTLHDIGKTKIKSHILHKPGKLSEKEYEEVKLHTVYGYELLKKVPGLPPSIPLTALSHHERENGEGYPFRLKGENTNYFAKIVAVADVFHAMSSDRVYHEAIPFYHVIRQMNEDAFGKFDPSILLVFLNKIMESLVGKQVMLSNKIEGQIIMINPYDPIHSLVKAGEDIIDLNREREIKIEKVLSE
jgi:HD-GYP domain-containing protein (c-di-GMP phosphodiesterase class II)